MQSEVSKVICVNLRKKKKLLKDCWATQKAKGLQQTCWPLRPGDALGLYSPRPVVCKSQRSNFVLVQIQALCQHARSLLTQSCLTLKTCCSAVMIALVAMGGDVEGWSGGFVCSPVCLNSFCFTNLDALLLDIFKFFVSFWWFTGEIMIMKCFSLSLIIFRAPKIFVVTVIESVRLSLECYVPGAYFVPGLRLSVGNLTSVCSLIPFCRGN